MLSDRPFFAYALLHPEFYESLDNYAPGPELREIVGRLLEASWETSVRGFWTNAAPKGYQFLQQGWKIHLSAVARTTGETLELAVPILAEHGIAFKFVSDERMLRLSLSKNWSRSGAGKFMTIYPRSEEEFLETIEELHQATIGLRGPYILSDRPYRDSRVVFYRYGEHVSRRRVEATGFLTPMIEAPDGTWQPDERTGYFRLPPWVTDPVNDRASLAPPGDAGVLLHDRYRVRSAIRFGATGGIYNATDTHTGREVVIREARPLLGIHDGGSDSFELLRKEARILCKLGPAGVLPEFVDLFQEWEHLFLVQERIEAQSLWGYAINFYYSRAEQSPADCFRMFRETALKLIAALRIVHLYGLVLRDLTRNNTLITADDKVKFIDLEFAYEVGSGDSVLWVQTPGYASPEQLRSLDPSFEDDYYSLGALLLDILTFNAAGLDLNRAGLLTALDLTLQDLRLPAGLADLIRGLTERDPQQRWDLDRAESHLRQLAEPEDQRPLFHHLSDVPLRELPSQELRDRVRDTVEGVARFIHAKTRLAREDTLWPNSAEAFLTNPVNLQYGAAGTAFFLLRAQGRVPPEALDWIAARTEASPCPPGLGRGLAGVALLLLECGRVDQALKLFELGGRSPLLREEPSLYFGAAGWGLAQLHFWHRLGEARFLEQAVQIGEDLVRSAREASGGLTWTPDQSPHGVIGGPSGISLFLIHLAAATESVRLLDCALGGLRFELAHKQELGAHLLWYPYADAPPSEPKSPHFWFGTAGIGAVLLRAYAVTGDPELRHWTERCAASVAERYTNKIWHDFGLAGFGELLLDCYAYLGDEKYLNAAFYLAEALLTHRIERPEGFAFLGQDHYRISCDLGWGTAGIGMFFHRLLEPATPRLLMIDSLLRARTAKDTLLTASPAQLAAR